ncbi:MAG: thioredoxin family protein [Thermoanaerobaculaceae bacterium]|nr:thioredoxin family protein [Thermoanaerobaculaceae bacterium]
MAHPTLVTALGTVFLLVGSQFGLALAIGDRAPAADVKMKGVDGRELSIKEIAGAKGTLVIFSCNHCPWVKAWEGRIAELGNAYQVKGIGVIVVNPNDPAAYPEDSFQAMQERAKARGFQFPYVVDATSGVAHAFGATRTPEAFLFDAAGVLVYHGAIDDNAENVAKVTGHFLRDALEAVVAGSKPAVAETKAIGCSIKFRSS